MRTLELNKTNLWYTREIGEIDVVDDEGNFTGEIEMEYLKPEKIRLHLYPASGEVLEESFGRSSGVEMISSTTDNILKVNDLIYYEEPLENYNENYDYSITSILRSLNSFQYGLKGRY